MASALPLLALGGAAVLLLGGKKKKKGPKERMVESGTFDDGLPWKVMLYNGIYFVDVNNPTLSHTEWSVIRHPSGMVMGFETLDDARVMIHKIEISELVYDTTTGSVSNV